VKEAQKALADAEQKAEDAQKNLADATQSVKNAQDALAAEKQKVKEAQDALAAEKQKFEDAQKAEEERAIKYQALFDLARGIGLDKGTSHDFAKANLDTDKSDLSSALDKVIEQELDHLKGISSNSYPKGKIISEDIDKGALIDNEDIVKKVQRKMVYNQKYSATIADYYVEESYNKTAGFLTDFNPVISNIHTQGLKTQVANIPTEGTATYLGKAFHGAINMTLPKPEESNTSRVIERAGTLSYTVNFADKTGAGRILGLGDQIILNQGQISGSGISSTAKQDTLTGSYSLDFFGKNAEEISGKVSLDGKDAVGFGGTRGEIQK
jgi:colicin import membrane protein (fragment)